jgi:YD repeat-containing protein
VTTVTDQAGKQRRSITNALGQLTRVDEPDANGQLGSTTAPNQPTYYAYDTLNNLTSVNQGVQTRTFSYNSLSRLLSANNPESGTINYGYDNNGKCAPESIQSAAFQVVWDGVNASYDIRLSLVKPGETVTLADGSTKTYQEIADARGQAVPWDDGSWDVLIPDGEFSVPGLSGTSVITNVMTMTPHEIAHAVKQDAVPVENAVRKENNLEPRDPDAHEDRDHKTGGPKRTVTIDPQSPTEIKMNPTPLPNIPPVTRPMIPLPKKPEEK